MTYDQATALLREFGFPVVVALWFMLRLEKRLDRLFELLGALMQSTALLAKTVDYQIDASKETGSHQALVEEEEDQ